jgi:GTP-binding protein
MAEIKDARFIASYTDVKALPSDGLPEFAFIGRSNVGKSSLINLLTHRKQLAKTSSTPGKTQTINHFLINHAWYLVDLPGYGYAHVNKGTHKGFGKIIDRYVLQAPQLHCLFILLDIRLEPQPIDLRFIQWAGEQGIPLALIFTKADKLATGKVMANRKKFEQRLLTDWEQLPPIFVTSAQSRKGREELLDFISKAVKEANPAPKKTGHAK